MVSITVLGFFSIIFFTLLGGQEGVVVQVENDSVHHLTDGSVKQLNVGHFAVTLILQHNWQADFPLLIKLVNFEMNKTFNFYKNSNIYLRQELINVRRHQSTTMTFVSSAQDFSSHWRQSRLILTFLADSTCSRCRTGRCCATRSSRSRVPKLAIG